MHDSFGNHVGCDNADAVRAYDLGVDRQLHAWPGALEAHRQALRHAPDFALARSAVALLLNSQGHGAAAREALAIARASPAALDARERSHLALIGHIVEGRPGEALDNVLEHARRWPTDALAASTAVGAYGLIAFSGRADHDARRLEFVDALAPHHAPEFAWLLANRGWARIEAGRVDEGKAMALRSLALRPDNGHLAHILMHAYFESDDPRAALAFIEGWLPGYPDHALMWGHLQWHTALAEIALGRIDEAMQRLLGPIVDYLARGVPFMGLIDIASLTWRLALLGRSGLPWERARQHAQQHFPNGSNPFGEVHLAMLAAARRDAPELRRSRDRLQGQAEAGQAGATSAMQWIDGLLALMAQPLDPDGIARAAFDACLAQCVRLGGSHAQRSVIELSRSAMALPAAVQPATPP